MEKCIKFSACPIFNNNHDVENSLISSYKRIFCSAGEYNHKICKRYQVCELLGYCPPNVYPNSIINIKESGELEKQIDNLK
jgi:hypothetical protein